MFFTSRCSELSVTLDYPFGHWIVLLLQTRVVLFVSRELSSHPPRRLPPLCPTWLIPSRPICIAILVTSISLLMLYLSHYPYSICLVPCTPFDPNTLKSARRDLPMKGGGESRCLSATRRRSASRQHPEERGGRERGGAGGRGGAWSEVKDEARLPALCVLVL